MITILVGHRGTGKTSLLGRIQAYLPGRETADLDELIESGEGETIPEIFHRRGEAAFRSLEHRYLKDFIDQERERDAFIAVGAGFTGPLPDGVHCLWVRRDTDRSGRIFLDRPRLDPGTDPLDEFLTRFEEREERYRTWADNILTLQEGTEGIDRAEDRYFSRDFTSPGGLLTILPETVTTEDRFNRWAALGITLGIEAFEVRDDLLTPEQIRSVLRWLRTERLLYSFRDPAATPPHPWPEGLRFDWDVDLGPCSHGVPHILSLHARAMKDVGNRLERSGKSHLKLAVGVDTFQDLLEGHRWAAGDPENRSFLPCSPDGRWSWYRRLFWRQHQVRFVREGMGSAPDQPTILEWMRSGPESDRFAAVLGDPVLHSRTPVEQAGYFLGKRLPVLAVRMTGSDWRSGALDVLRELGLRCAAVTAPLKKLAHETCSKVTPVAERLASVNTLHLDEATNTWHGTNTDLEGLKRALEGIDSSGDTVVWGGGGTLAMLQEVFPGAAFFSARTGKQTRGPTTPRPGMVVFATGRKGAPPPAAWRPEVVYDLDYREGAPGRAFALRTGARYVSGLAMFKHQAEGQRAWWDSRLENV